MEHQFNKSLITRLMNRNDRLRHLVSFSLFNFLLIGLLLCPTLLHSSASGGFIQDAGPQSHPGWRILPQARDLITTAYWDAMSPPQGASLSVNNGALMVTAGADFFGALNVLAPQFKVGGDFGGVATMTASDNGTCVLTLTGSLNTATEFWKGLKQIAFGLDRGKVVFYYFDGTKDTPAAFHSFNAGPFSGPVNLEVLRQGGAFLIFANGAMVGQTSDIGIFDSGHAYLGFTVSPGAQMTISDWAIETPEGQTRNVEVILPAAEVNRTPSADALRSLAARAGRTFGVGASPLQLAAGGTYYCPCYPAPVADPSYREKVVGEFGALNEAPRSKLRGIARKMLNSIS